MILKGQVIHIMLNDVALYRDIALNKVDAYLHHHLKRNKKVVKMNYVMLFFPISKNNQGFGLGIKIKFHKDNPMYINGALAYMIGEYFWKKFNPLMMLSI